MGTSRDTVNAKVTGLFGKKPGSADLDSLDPRFKGFFQSAEEVNATGPLTEQRPPGPDATDARLAALRRAETERKLREARGAKSSFLFGGSDTTGNGFKPDNILGSRR